MESNHEELVVRLLQLVLADGNDGKKREVSKVAEMLNELKNGIDKEKLEKILKELEEIKKEKDGDVNKLELKVKESPKMRKEPQVTVTGAKNAKLICIKDDNSVIETDEEIDPEIKDKSNEKCTIPLKAVSSSHTQTDCDKINKSTQRPTNQCHVMKKLKRSSRHLKMLPKDYVIKIIQYKLNFHKYCKNIPMYRKTANIQPWILMSRVSDNMLDLALLQVAQEIEANDIAAQIYRSELQL